MVFVRECIRIGVDGFYMSTQGSETGQLEDPTQFAKYVRPSDLVAMREVTERCPFNILHVCDYNAPYADYAAVADYPGHVVNCSPELADGRVLSWQEIARQFKRPAFGGMQRKGVIASGSVAEIQAETEAVLRQAPTPFMLGAECTIPGETSWDNLRAAIRTAHAWKRS
jgi:uroporphyrinogen decarboxylase